MRKIKNKKGRIFHLFNPLSSRASALLRALFIRFCLCRPVSNQKIKESKNVFLRGTFFTRQDIGSRIYPDM
jgi:hypothetical protein